MSEIKPPASCQGKKSFRIGPADISPPDSIGARTRFARNILIKGFLLFVLANLIFAWVYPLNELGQISAYNLLFPGRLRLPYADNPDRAYSISLDNLEAMFASHQLAAGKKPAGEYRVLLIGDSATWGFLLPPGQTLAGFLNENASILPDQRSMKFYNLGYPVMSLTKDLLLLSYASGYEPDLIIWLVTLESFPNDKQLFPPLLQNNPEAVQQLNEKFKLNLNLAESGLVQPGYWDRTIIGSRRELADLFRLQFYGPLWAATGIDQDIPETFTPRQEDFDTDLSFHSLQPYNLHETDLAFNILEAGTRMVESTPVIIINEPMFISQGIHSDLRYNFYYPRWAYDDYRQMLAEKSAQNHWHYRDFWNIIPADKFTNSAIHLSSEGNRLFADWVLKAVMEEIDTLSIPQ